MMDTEVSYSVFSFLSAQVSPAEGDISAGRFKVDVVSQAFIMSALADDLTGFASTLLQITL